MKKFTLTAVGRDQTGIVSRLTQVLYKYKINIEDSSMTRLGSEFAVILIMTAPSDLDSAKLLDSLSKVEKEVGLSIQFKEMDEEDTGETLTGNYLITVYGADTEGIVFKTTNLLAELGVSITDLNSKKGAGKDSGDKDIYIMVIEANIPEGPEGPETVNAEDIEDKLTELGKEIGVHITVKEIEIFEGL